MGRTYRKRSKRRSRKRRCKHGRLRNPYKSKKSGKMRICKSKRKRRRKCKRGRTRDRVTKKCRRKRKPGRMSKKAKSKRARANWRRISRKAKNVGAASAAFTEPLLS